MRQILLTGEEPYVGTALLRHVIPNSSAEHGILGLERINDRTLRNLPFDLKLYLSFDSTQCSKMRRQYNTDHGNVCTSTERTAGRSRAIGAQLSPASADA
jgi:hypothetical protein